MSSNTEVSPEIFDFLQSLASKSNELDQDVNQINTVLENYLSLPIDDLQFNSISEKLNDIIQKIDREITQTESALNLVNNPNFPPLGTNEALMFASSHRKMFDFYLAKELEIISMPYPPLCGAIPQSADKPLPLGSFVAAKLDDYYIVCYVQGTSEDATKYIIADATLVDPSVNFTVDRTDVIPLPASLPDRKTKYTEHSPGKKVLSLWPVETTWTSVFYSATVLKSPSETGRLYKLKFEGSDEKAKYIPEKYIIPHP